MPTTASTSDARDRLQPALLDRLADDAPDERVDADAQRVMSKAQLRQAVLRDLGSLFNAVQPLAADSKAGELDSFGNPGAAPNRYPPLIADSVLNYGLPPLSGQLASRLDVAVLERAIRQAIVRFEPRILPQTLRIRALEATSVLDTHNVIEFEIRGHLWSQPVPLEILLRTQLDLEAGQVEVREASAHSFR